MAVNPHNQILLIGSEDIRGINVYPHLACFQTRLAQHCQLSYFQFRERGMFLQAFIHNPKRFRAYVNLLRSLGRAAIDATRLKFSQTPFDVVIAIDQYAYLIASAIFRRTRVVLWSHDIVDQKHPLYSHCLMSIIVEGAGKAIQTRRQVIIQDSNRLQVLADSYHIPASSLNVFFMPAFLDQATDLPPEIHNSKQPILMQCGGIGGYRYSDDLLAHYQTHHHLYQLRIHGFLAPEIHDYLPKCPVKPAINQDPVRSQHMPSVIADCDIGFVAYRTQDLNHRYIAFASGQLTEFLRMGKPVIVMGPNDLRAFAQAEGLGIGIDTVDQLPTAIKKIVDRYDTYATNALACYRRYFRPEPYMKEFQAWLFDSVRTQS